MYNIARHKRRFTQSQKKKRRPNGKINGMHYRMMSRDVFNLPKKGDKTSLKVLIQKSRSEIAYRCKRLESMLRQPQNALFTREEKQATLVKDIRHTLMYVAFFHKCIIKYLRMFEPIDADIHLILAHRLNDNDILKIPGAEESNMLENTLNLSLNLKREFEAKEVDLSKLNMPNHKHNYKKIMIEYEKKRKANWLNIDFYIQEFYIQLVNSLQLCAATYYTTGLKESGYRMMLKAVNVCLKFQSSMSNDMLRSQIKCYMLLARMQVERGELDMAVDLYNRSIELSRREISIIFNKTYLKDKKGTGHKHKRKSTEAFNCLVMTSINLMNLYIYRNELDRVVESLEFANWFVKRFMEKDSELFSEFYHFKNRFDKQFKPLYMANLEMERVIKITSQQFNMDVNDNMVMKKRHNSAPMLVHNDQNMAFKKKIDQNFN